MGIQDLLVQHIVHHQVLHQQLHYVYPFYSTRWNNHIIIYSKVIMVILVVDSYKRNCILVLL